ncbi:hypothetical protein ASG43_12420 [Aureimonas sp. Leaf454]|uniref:hypothetical protein n=1 Tax=Aureimonas sp. Leaf454 TaxID=1736381 RepID=UPI0006FF207B|nr:hypothetical protein [Aureimonas sp. Leaf454]KQT45104.1 hypothetical protein ASG43_12420 [Aureimonas sp. Leaf454]
MKTLILAAAALVLATSFPAAAQTYRSDVRQHRQNERIDRGYQRGHLTPREARRLDRQQQRIRQVERRARAMNGGYVDPRTQRRLERMQDRADRNIYRKNNNRRGYY